MKNMFRAIPLPLYQAPDAPGANVDPQDPPVDPKLAADPPAANPPAADPPVDPQAPGGTEKPDGRKNPWYLKRIADEAERARLAETRAADAEALAARLQAGKEPPAVDPARTASPAAAPAQDFNAAVRTEAQRLRLAEESTAVRSTGLREFGAAFLEDLNILTAIGATGDEIVLDLLAVDKPNAHKILANLAKDPEQAASLVGMDSRRRIAELTRMADAIAPKTENALTPKTPVVPPKQVSRAPAPPPPVDPSASKTVDWRSDDADDATFSKGWEENTAKRANLRR